MDKEEERKKKEPQETRCMIRKKAAAACSSLTVKRPHRKRSRHVGGSLPLFCGGQCDTHRHKVPHALDFWGFEAQPGAPKQSERVGKRRFTSVPSGGMADRDPVPLPVEVRAKLAELELELSEGE